MTILENKQNFRDRDNYNEFMDSDRVVTVQVLIRHDLSGL